MKLQTRFPVLTVLFAAVVAAAGCEQVKSANPLSPQIAGPMEGVSITAPKLLEPEVNRQFKANQQPLTLVIENSQSNSPRPFTYTIEIASDAAFASKVWTREKVQPGSNGRTTQQLPDPLPVGRVYFWRVQAQDGANASEYSVPRAFEVLQPVVIGTPVLQAPVANVRVTTRRPTLTVGNASRSGPHGTLRYYFEVGLDQAFASRVVFEDEFEGAGQTSTTMPIDLANDIVHYWRARVSDGETTGAWSPTETFRTPVAIIIPPPTPTPPPGSGANCASSNGDAIVQCIANRYPDKTAAGVSLDQRVANMEFIRDRVIEAGICGGLDLARNLKRGVGPHSIDAIAWRVNGRDEVVDLGVGYDDNHLPLRLQWIIVAGPPGYDYYTPRPTCK